MENKERKSGCKLIPLSQGKFAIVDAEDYDRLSSYKWAVSKKRNNWYAKGRCGGLTIKMHRVIMGLKKGDGKEVDHRNGNGLDNRKENLRLCSHAENLRNQRRAFSPKYTSQRKGVY